MQFESRPVDAEFVRLIHDLQSTEIIGHKYRGYTLLPQDGRDMRSIKVSVQLSAVIW
jgi:fatty acid synthase